MRPAGTPRRARRPAELRVALVALALAAGCGHTLPRGETGAAADALAHRIEAAVHADAWARTGAVRFVFRGSTEHLWDRSRGLARVRFRDRDDEVLLDVATQRGRAYHAGRELAGPDADKLVHRGYERFINDTFWLNPLVKLFDDGVTRTRVTGPDGESLIVHYASGGVTPGDTYQWLLGADGLPRAWRLWVKVIKIRGLELSWEGWTTLATGALVATRHRAGPVDAVRLTELAAAGSLAELEPGADPFAPLAAP
jgi:hypothetical protein